MKNIIIIDYGLSNLLSVKRAFAFYNVDAQIESDYREIRRADVLILPGVGAFEDGMRRLNDLDITKVLTEKVKTGIPLLGICLGMQMLFDESEEFGIHKGLGFIPGKVVKIPDKDMNGCLQKVPHISWNPLLPVGEKLDFGGTILESIGVSQECYFIHSYEAKPLLEKYRIADTVYGGRRVCAVAQKDNVIGTQFHPEKSGSVGLKIVEKFVEMYCE